MTPKLLRVFLAVSGAVLALVAYRIQVRELGSSEARALAQVVLGLTFLAAGLVAWSRRPAHRLGVLMVVTAFALLLRQLRYSHDPVLFTTFFALGDVGYAMVGHCVLAYPSGRVTDRLERGLVALGYTTTLALPLVTLLFYDATRPLLYFDPSSRESLLLVWPDASAVEVLQEVTVLVLFGVLASLFIAAIVRRLVRATPRARRMLAPLLLAGIAVALRAVFETGFTFVSRPFALETLFWWQLAALIALPLALVAGLLRAHLARVGVGSLVLELERTPTTGLRDALARALGDPTLDVAFWLPERGGYVDASGRPVELPSGGTRAVRHLEHDGEPVAAIVHDRTLLEEPELVDAAGAAARLALANARLQAELQAQLIAVRESRGRIVAAADAERRRIERDLHDGAQQRLLALALALRSTERRHQGALDPEVESILGAAVGELQQAVEELRELAHGVHPTILAEQGLEAALRSLATRMPLRVDVDVGLEGRPDPRVETAAYFVACEALTNVAKHAAARSASVTAAQEDGVVSIVVADDGIGGADAEGSGLRGLADRIEALGGTLAVGPGPRGGTRIAADIPFDGP
jgi:signal transduction histidine kinase